MTIELINDLPHYMASVPVTAITEIDGLWLLHGEVPWRLTYIDSIGGIGLVLAKTDCGSQYALVGKPSLGRLRAVVDRLQQVGDNRLTSLARALRQPLLAAAG